MGLFDEKKKGLFDDDDEFLQSLLNEESYPPYVTELREATVQALFLRCIATKETKSYLKSVLYQKEFGYEQDSPAILFDKDKILENLKSVLYLYGQLMTTHRHSNTISTSPENVHNSTINYKGEKWTDKDGILKQFFHLGVVCDIIYPFNENGNSIFKFVNILPTLSPNDDNFDEWWETHKVRFEGRK